MIGIETEEPKFVFDIGLVFKLKLKYNPDYQNEQMIVHAAHQRCQL